jgi:hypothetical protein
MICFECKKEFVPPKVGQVFCPNVCRKRHNNLKRKRRLNESVETVAVDHEVAPEIDPEASVGGNEGDAGFLKKDPRTSRASRIAYTEPRRPRPDPVGPVAYRGSHGPVALFPNRSAHSPGLVA